MVIRSLTLALAAALLAACTVGPDYVRPDLPVPAQFARQQAGDAPAAVEQGGVARVSADAEFWLGFDDPVLTALVDESLRANHDLRIALSRYDSANALLRGARLDRFPTVTAQASGVDGRSSADQAPGVARDDRDYERYDAGAALSWELDLFGRVRRGVEARRAEAWASASDLDAMQIAVVSEVVRTYADLRGQQERLRVARGNADNQRETLRLVQALFDAGRGTEFDTSRAAPSSRPRSRACRRWSRRSPWPCTGWPCSADARRRR